MKLIALIICIIPFFSNGQYYEYNLKIDQPSKNNLSDITKNLDINNRSFDDTCITFLSTIYYSKYIIDSICSNLNLDVTYITIENQNKPNITRSANVDCENATLICNNASFTGNASGVGTQELNSSNRGCLIDNERQSAWYYLSIDQAGTLEMTITPSGNADYDFAIWGPFTSANIGNNCPPLTGPIRCSYASPPCINPCFPFCCGRTYLTGLGNGATDFSEGAGGDAWVAPLNVNSGEFYILLIDNFSISSIGYTVSWGGSATLGCTPVILPIQFIGWNIDNYTKYNRIKWETLSETSDVIFYLYKSLDGNIWNLLHIQSGSGYGSAYSYIDTDVKHELVYYKLEDNERLLGILTSRRNLSKVIKILNLLGQEVTEEFVGLKIFIYDDNTIEKRY
jgi:hypothetical protein